MIHVSKLCRRGQNNKNIAFLMIESVIDGKTNNLVANVTVDLNPVAIAVNPNTNMVYVDNRASNTVSVIDGKPNRVVADTLVGTVPRAIAVNPNTNIVYVANYFSNTVSIIDSRSNNVVAGVSFNVNPFIAGSIYCNGLKIFSNYTLLDIGTSLQGKGP